MFSPKYKSLYKIIIILSSVFAVSVLVLPGFCFSQAGGGVAAIKAPENLGEAKDFTIMVLKSLPQGLKDGWRDAKEIFRKTWVKWWHNSIKPWFQSVWQEIRAYLRGIGEKTKVLLGQKIRERIPIVKEELKKEEGEMAKELSKIIEIIKEKFKDTFSWDKLWEKFKGLW